MWTLTPPSSKGRVAVKAVFAGGLFLLLTASFLTYLWLHRSSSTCAGEFDLAIIGGEIVDGLGGAPFRADIGIRGKQIVCIGRIKASQAAQIVDATGLTVAPGFIDVHTHVERNLPARAEPFLAPNFVRQGVTTLITGNCGRSLLDLGKAFARLEANGTQVNIASFIGHNTIRHQVMGDSPTAPSIDQLAKMKSLIAAGMNDGALGLSTGLEYIPGAFATTGEITELARVLRNDGGIYVSHIRNEGADGLAAIREAITIGEGAGVHVHISHFKAEGPHQWGSASARLSVLQAAKERGLTVSLDQYPYTASSTTIAILLPSWISSGGRINVRDRLKNPSVHARVRAEMLQEIKRGGWADYSFARVSYCGFDHSVVGLTIPQIVRARELLKPKRNDGTIVNVSYDSKSTTPETDLERQADTVIELFVHGDVQMVFFNMSEADVETIMRNPNVMFGSDSSVRDESSESLPHPRGLGTFPRVLGLYGRDKQLFTLEEGIRRMTSLPAQTFNLKMRGQIREGYFADLVVFDRSHVIDTATYERPLSSPDGIYYVLVNGSIAVDGSIPTRSRTGMVLRRLRTCPPIRPLLTLYSRVSCRMIKEENMEQLNREKNSLVFREPENVTVKIWRYMDFTKFVSLLDLRSLYFVRSDLLGDPFEGTMPTDNFRFYSLVYGTPPLTPDGLQRLSKVRQELRQRVYVNCWHLNELESFAMWHTYARSNEAIALQSTYQSLRQCLPTSVNIGCVQYIDYKLDFVPEDNLLRPFLYKRKSFEHERELRALIGVADDDEETWVGQTVGSVGRIVSVALADLIERVYVAPTSPEWFADLVQSVMTKYDLKKPVIKSHLDDKPSF